MNQDFQQTKEIKPLLVGNDDNDYYQELNIGKGNATSKENIESETKGFRESAINNGGYYIGRYEARTTTPRSVSTENNSLSKITVKPNDYIYNWVTQLQAAKLSQEMYSDSSFESDLMNSYAWDTAIDFLQKCDDRIASNSKPYSIQNSINTVFANKGTNNLELQDVICDVYDMASNCYEWTTETCNTDGYPCVLRGGNYDSSDHCTTSRNLNITTRSHERLAFRPILYVK